MLTSEEAREKIAALKIEDWLSARTKAVLRSPLARARTIRAAYEPRAGEKARDADETQLHLASAFVSMSAVQRAELFGLWFPRLSPVMEHTWHALARRAPSHADGASRKPFRAPRNEQVLARVRAEWFNGLCRQLEGLDQDVAWVADWCSHIESWWPGHLSWLLAGAIDGGGPTGRRVLDSLLSIIRGGHEISSISENAVRALLSCACPEAWEAVEKLLVAARREEGLRQTILESVDEAHPDAFRRMLRVILENGLSRFSATVRAVDVWFGFEWDAVSVKVVEGVLEKTSKFLDDDGARDRALEKGSAEDGFLALWATAFNDIEAAIPLARRLMRHKDPERRYAAYHVLVQSGFELVEPAIRPGLADPDDRVAAAVNDYYRQIVPAEARSHLFGPLEALLKRFPKKTRLKPILWPWTARNYEPGFVSWALVKCVDDQSAERLIPHLPRIDPVFRPSVAATLAGIEGLSLYDWDQTKPPPAKTKPISTAARKALLGLLGDASAETRKAAFAGMHGRSLEADEVAILEELLGRKASDLRALVIGRLMHLDDDALLDSARRLGAGRAEMRAGAFELLRAMAEQRRAPDRVRALAEELAGRAKLSDPERSALEAIRTSGQPRLSADDAFGLLDPAALSPPPRFEARPLPRLTPAAWAIVFDLDRLIDRHKEAEIRHEEYKETELLGAERTYCLPRPKPRENTIEQDRARLPLLDTWTVWYSNRPAGLRDDDGLELVRAWVAAHCLYREFENLRWPRGLLDEFGPERKAKSPRYAEQIMWVIEWLLRLHPEVPWAPLVLDAAEGAAAAGRVIDDIDPVAKKGDPPIAPDGAFGRPLCLWLKYLSELTSYLGPPRGADETRWLRLGWTGHLIKIERESGEDDDNRESIWDKQWKAHETGRLSEHEDERFELNGFGVSAAQAVRAVQLGLINRQDLLRYVIAKRPGSSAVSSFTSRAGRADMPDIEGLDALIARVRERLIDIELTRGDAVGPATPYACELDDSGGRATCVRALAGLGRQNLKRAPGYRDDSKATSFSRLISRSRPRPDDTGAAFAADARAAGLADDRLVELGVFAPQWASHVEHTLQWPGFEDAVWWIHAHTKDNDWRIDDDIREAWDARIAERTPIPPDELKEGAVDSDWFTRVHKALGGERWARVYAAAKYACSGIGHKRAQLFADAMLGAASEAELIKRVNQKRHQDSIRALGLAPLKAGDAGRKQVHARYRVMQEIRRTSRKHGGSMLQASERRAVEIGLDNLARTAGYPDPLRLTWALETEAVADLAKGPVTAAHGKGDKRVAVTLAVDAEGAVEVAATKGGKPLKTIPPEVKKSAEVAALIERSKELRKSGSRMRQALEGAMCRGDEFSADELRGLWSHPVLRPMLQRLVFVGPASILGYPDRDARVLRDHAGRLEPLKGGDKLRVAHPHDLLGAGQWERWQRECFAAERVQPFKQVFRELYVPSAKEGPGATTSTRYAGHQVQPRQALALLGSRQWVSRPEEGIQRTFHKERLTARLDFEEPFFTPAEVEGLTISSLRFTRAGKLEDVPFKDIPPRLFSEVMRDLDLVVSVAHRGGVDPEATESTVELRAALLRETCTLLEIANISIDNSRATIRGQRATYSLHLGSGTVQMLPGGSLYIVPVHSQHRGRLFLPFADNDPKTAEIISKAILLARDTEIQDPSIAHQITRLAR